MLELWKAGPSQKQSPNFLSTTASPTYTCTTPGLDVTRAMLIALSSREYFEVIPSRYVRDFLFFLCSVIPSEVEESLTIPVKQNSMRCLGPARHDKKASRSSAGSGLQTP